MHSRIAAVAILALVVSGAAVSVLRAQASRSVWEGVYTEEQAQRGAVLYEQECAQCHGPAGVGGGMAPPLVGVVFSANYEGLTVGDLFDRNRTTMPPGKEGELSAQQNADITAYMLQCNKFPAGKTELSSQSMLLKQILYLTYEP